MSGIESARISNWRKVVLSPDNTVEDAINTLDKGALGIVLIAENHKLAGTVTDGDIRRALIKQLPTSTKIRHVMFPTPVSAYVGDSPQLMLEKMQSRNILHLPIVNKDGILVGLETLKHLVSIERYDNPVFLMAGGFGKRLRPFTEDLPKPLLKVGEVPLMEKILVRFVEHGFHNFFISIHYKAEIVQSHFADGQRWGVNINYVHEETPLGTAGALGLLPKGAVNKPVIMMNGDLVTGINFANLLEFHRENKGVATVCVREYEFQVPYGVIYRDGIRIRKIEEKPVHKFFINAGIYVLEPELVHGVKPNLYLDMPNLLEKHLEAGDEVNMFPLHEYWLDIGQKDEYQRAQDETSINK